MKEGETCTWAEEEWYDYWDTSCGNAHSFVAGTPKSNGYAFCPYCGKPLEEKQETNEIER